MAKKVEKTTGIPKTYLAIGIATLLTIITFFNFAGQLVSNLIGFVYPAYSSAKAIESKGKDDDTQWLTYWCVYGFLSVAEFFSDKLLEWFPFYYFAKSCFLIWLYSPMTLGALKIYQGFIQKQVQKAEEKKD